MGSTRKTTPLRNPENRMNQLVNLAVESAEERLRNGTASSQIICLLLNLATTKAQIELEKLRTDAELSKAKIDQIKSSEDLKEITEEALNALKSYRGNQEMDDIDDEEYY